MINGYAKICQGWRLLENKHITKDSIKTDRISKISNTYDVRIQSPTNKVFGPISNLNQFCKEHGLSQSSMHDLIKGKRKAYKGWILLDQEEKENVSTTLPTNSIE